jgi:hypothetical protein
MRPNAERRPGEGGAQNDARGDGNVTATVTPAGDAAAELEGARTLARRFGAYLMCRCGRAEIGDDGACPRCAAEDGRGAP